MLGDNQWCSPCCCCKVPPDGGVSFGGDFTDKCWNVLGANALDRLRFESQTPWRNFFTGGGGGQTQQFATRCLAWPPAAAVSYATLRLRATATITQSKGPSFGDENQSIVAVVFGESGFSLTNSGSFTAYSACAVRSGVEFIGGEFVVYEYRQQQYRLHGLNFEIDPKLSAGRNIVIDDTFHFEDGHWWLGKKQLWASGEVATPHYGIFFSNGPGHGELEVFDFSVDFEYS
jgi:hypothetical protein